MKRLRDKKSRLGLKLAAQPFLFFDTEDDSKELLEAGKSGFDKKVTQIAALGETDEIQFYGKSADDFLDWLEDRSEKIVYAHNVKYDLGNLFADRLDLLDVVMVGGRLIRARWRGKTFLDSYNIWPMKLATLGKKFKLEKLVFDSKGKAYVFRDVQILRAAMLFARDFAFEHGLDRLPSTLGGLSVHLFHRLGLSNEFDAEKISRAGLFGGRVELFQTGGRGNLYYVDLNSLYPFALTKKFPVAPDYQKRPDFKSGYGVADVKISVPRQWLAPLPARRDDGSVYYPTGTFRGIWTYAEIDNAVRHYGAKVLRIFEAYGSKKADDSYAPFIRKFYRARIASKTESEKLMLKLLLNNLYGQLCVTGKLLRSVDVNNPKHDGIPYGRKKLAELFMPLPLHCNWLHAAYVTSYGRIRLLKFLRVIGKQSLIYCDTDSAIFFWPKGKKLPFKFSDKLGEMKLVARGRLCEVFAPKTYRFDDDWKAKGVRSSFAKTFIEAGEASYASPFQLREAITFYDAGNLRKLSVWRVVKKQFRTQYDKKVLTSSVFSPIHLATRSVPQNATQSKAAKKEKRN